MVYVVYVHDLHGECPTIIGVANSREQGQRWLDEYLEIYPDTHDSGCNEFKLGEPPAELRGKK